MSDVVRALGEHHAERNGYFSDRAFRYSEILS